MRAWIVEQPGGPDVLHLRELPEPEAQDGQVRIRVRAFGLNRAEAVTRAGGSGAAVPFPRVIGIECVGEVIVAPGTDLAPGVVVAAAMGGMGRSFDGSYAEQTVVPRSNVFPLETSLAWAELAAIPETFLTALGCLRVTRALADEQRVVVRPGASALGLAIAQIAGHRGGEVVGITRSPRKRAALLAGGMHHVLVSKDAVAEKVRRIWPDGATAVIDTVASRTSVTDDLAMMAPPAMLCLAGSLAESYGSAPAAADEIFARDNVTFYSSETLEADRDGANLQEIVARVESGDYRTNIAEILDFTDVPAGHEGMEANAYAGKVVVVL